MLKREERELASIVGKLTRGVEFLMRKDVAVMRKTGMQSADCFTSAMSPDRYSSIDKEIGSELVFIASALADLRKMLERS